MAETKTKSTRRTKSSTRTKAKGSSKPKQAKAPTSGRRASRNGSKSNGLTSGKVVREALGAGKEAGQSTAKAVGRARVPIMAAGAVAIGAVGGAAFGATRSGTKVLGVRMPQGKRMKIRSRDLKKAAKEVRTFGDQVGDLTEELKRIRKGMAKA